MPDMLPHSLNNFNTPNNNRIPYVDQRLHKRKAYQEAYKRGKNWLHRKKRRDRPKKQLPPIPPGTPGDPRVYLKNTMLILFRNITSPIPLLETFTFINIPSLAVWSSKMSRNKLTLTPHTLSPTKTANFLLVLTSFYIVLLQWTKITNQI